MSIDRLSVRIEKLESKVKAKNRRPVTMFYQQEGETDEEFDIRIADETKDWEPEPGRIRIIKFMQPKRPTS